MCAGRALAELGLALWLGGGVGTLQSTRAVFRHLKGQPMAGTIAADALAALSRLTWISIALVAAGFWLAEPGAARWPALGAALLHFASDLFVRPTLRRMRAELGGSIEHAAPDDPRRKRFGALHGVSMLLLLGQLVGAAASLILLS
jgi:hypothetical protein